MHDPGPAERPLEPFRWLGHAALLLHAPETLVVDPWRGRAAGAGARAALVTHAHGDHCDEDDLDAACGADAPVLAPPAAAARLARRLGQRLVAVQAGDTRRVAGCDVTVLPAAGPLRRGRASGFLPPGSGAAYLVAGAAFRALVLGDSRVLAEHEGLAPDLAFVAVGGLVTATPEEAADDVARLGARCVVPVHWGDLEGRHVDAQRFAALCAARGVVARVPGAR